MARPGSSCSHRAQTGGTIEVSKQDADDAERTWKRSVRLAQLDPFIQPFFPEPCRKSQLQHSCFQPPATFLQDAKKAKAIQKGHQLTREKKI